MWEITFTLNVSNIVLVIFKSFITICWGKNLDKIKKSHIKSQSQYLEKKIAIRLFSQIAQPYLGCSLLFATHFPSFSSLLPFPGIPISFRWNVLVPSFSSSVCYLPCLTWRCVFFVYVS